MLFTFWDGRGLRACGFTGGGELDLVLRMFLNKLGKRLESAVTIVVDERTTAGGLEFEGWETRDAEGGRWGDIVLSGIHLGAVDLVNKTGEFPR